MEAGAVSFHDREKVRKVGERERGGRVCFLKYNLVGWLGECGEEQ